MSREHSAKFTRAKLTHKRGVTFSFKLQCSCGCTVWRRVRVGASGVEDIPGESSSPKPKAAALCPAIVCFMRGLNDAAGYPITRDQAERLLRGEEA